MSNTLHIVNGDHTADILKLTNLKGDMVVWREVLCEGTILKEVGSDEFWQARYAYFENELGVSKLEYFDNTIKEIIQLEDLEGYTNVVLWFEYDLFCQVNLLAACTYLLNSFRKDIAYALVCAGFEKGKKTLQTLANYSPKEYHKLYENKLKLTRNNLVFAQTCWELYAENSKQKLENFNFQHSKFKYLSKAMAQHFKRFPGANGLNEIETKMLQIVNDNSYSKNEIIKQMLLWQNQETVYGFGDLQYFNYLKNLEAFFNIKDEIYTLNKLGLSKIDTCN